MYACLFLIFSFGLVLRAHSQTIGYQWGHGFGAANWDEGYDVKMDHEGNIVTMGRFSGSVDFDPGPGTSILTSAGNIDMYIMKLDSAGNLLWVHAFDLANMSYGFDLAVDSIGNIFCIGNFTQSVDFEPDTSAFVLSPHPSGGDVFILKLTPYGQLGWARNFGGTRGVLGYAIALDDVGNVYSTGTFGGTIDFDPGPNSYLLTSPGQFSNAGFVTVLDSNGALIWAKAFSASNSCSPEDIDVDVNGNVLVIGTFTHTVDFDPDTSQFIITSAYNTGSDAFVCKLSNAGQFVWAKLFSGPGTEYGRELVTDRIGHVYAIGAFAAGTVDL
jgi:hypothetical protein